jgi:hypothetical protein
MLSMTKQDHDFITINDTKYNLQVSSHWLGKISQWFSQEKNGFRTMCVEQSMKIRLLRCVLLSTVK